MGSANNIAATLQISKNINGDNNLYGETIRFDCGQITGMDEEKFCIESVGMGILPELI